MPVKNNAAVEKAQVTTIQVSIETHGKLTSLCSKLEQILHKRNVTIDQAIKVMFETNPLDVVLQKLMEEKW